MKNKMKRLGLGALAVLSPVAAFATAPTPGTFGAYVDFSNITADVTYVGYLIVTLALLVAGIRIVVKMLRRA